MVLSAERTSPQHSVDAREQDDARPVDADVLLGAPGDEWSSVVPPRSSGKRKTDGVVMRASASSALDTRSCIIRSPAGRDHPRRSGVEVMPASRNKRRREGRFARAGRVRLEMRADLWGAAHRRRAMIAPAHCPLQGVSARSGAQRARRILWQCRPAQRADSMSGRESRSTVLGARRQLGFGTCPAVRPDPPLFT